jgi:hypothetical protein
VNYYERILYLLEGLVVPSGVQQAFLVVNVEVAGYKCTQPSDHSIYLKHENALDYIA